MEYIQSDQEQKKIKEGGEEEGRREKNKEEKKKTDSECIRRKWTCLLTQKSRGVECKKRGESGSKVELVEKERSNVK